MTLVLLATLLRTRAIVKNNYATIQNDNTRPELKDNMQNCLTSISAPTLKPLGFGAVAYSNGDALAALLGRFCGQP
jgi:hypothetical protein